MTSGSDVDQIGPYFEHVPEQRLRLFCEAVGVDYNGSAPLTFMTVFRRGEFDLLQRRGVALSSILHAEQEYEFQAPILPGAQIEFGTRISKSHQKRGSGGLLQFLVFETQVKEFLGDSKPGKILGISRSTIVVREAHKDTPS